MRKSERTGEHLTLVLVRAFRSHWRRILRSLDQKRSVAAQRCDCFEADTTEKQRSLARSFYGRGHVERLVRLSAQDVHDRLSAAYLPAAIQYCLESMPDEPAKQDAFMRTLVKGEYVIIDGVSGWDNLGAEDRDWSGCTVGPYPAAYYDDWYGRAGEDCVNGFLSVIFKSTGEPFSAREVEWMVESVKANLESNSEDEEARWSCDIQEGESSLFISASKD